MSGKFDDTWVCERVLFPDTRDAAQAVMSLYKDKTLVESSSPSETLYSVVPDTRNAITADASMVNNLREHFGLALDAVAEYHHDERLGRLQTFWSFNHSWALKPWAEQVLSGPRDRRTLLVHFDSHDDLASPTVGLTDSPGVFQAPAGESTLILNEPSTIDEFVLRGFTGIGSFVVPLLHTVAEFDIVHVARHHRVAPEEFALLREERIETTITGRQLRRPSVKMAPHSHEANLRYTRTCDVDFALELARGRDLILDIDLDYFCNAFDDKLPDAATRDGEKAVLRDVVGSIVALGRSLEANGIVPSLVTVALSPGFYPSDGWSTAVPCLTEILARL